MVARRFCTMILCQAFHGTISHLTATANPGLNPGPHPLNPRGRLTPKEGALFKHVCKKTVTGNRT